MLLIAKLILNFSDCSMDERLHKQSLEMDSKLNEFKSFQDNIYRKFMEQTRLMLEQNIKM